MGHPQLGRVSNRKRDSLDAHLFGHSRSLAVQPQRGAARRKIGDLKILPAHAALPARADRLHPRFLGRKPAGIALEAIGLALHISDLAVRVNAADEAVAIPPDSVAD